MGHNKAPALIIKEGALVNHVWLHPTGWDNLTVETLQLWEARESTDRCKHNTPYVAEVNEDQVF